MEPTATYTAAGLVIFREIGPLPAAKTISGAVDIDDLVAEFEASPEGAEAMAKGREWVAEHFYGDRPPSVAKLRLQRGWSQAELARRAETSQSYIGRLESGNVDPQVSTVRKLAKALGLPLATVVQAISPENDA